MPAPSYVYWIVAANAERCRVLEERERGGELHEVRLYERGAAEERHARHEKAVQGQKFGFGRPTVNEQDFQKEAERRFLARCAHELDLAAVKNEYEGLIILAPPTALGMLRKELGPGAQRRLELTEACECVEEKPDQLRQRVRELHARR